MKIICSTSIQKCCLKLHLCTFEHVELMKTETSFSVCQTTLSMNKALDRLYVVFILFSVNKWRLPSQRIDRIMNNAFIHQLLKHAITIKACNHETVFNLPIGFFFFFFFLTTTRLMNNLALAASCVSSKKRAPLNKLKCALPRQKILKPFYQTPCCMEFFKNKYWTTSCIFELL